MKNKKHRGGNGDDSVRRVENQPYSYDIDVEHYRGNGIFEKINEKINGIYSGPWKYNQPYMRGKIDILENNNTTIKATYEGSWIDGKPDGKDCNYTTAIGNTYKGEYKEGLMHGVGTFTYNNGSKYAGEFKNGFIDGEGTLTYNNGSIYNGKFKRNFKDGYGILTYINGSRYEGQWKNNQKNGIGTFYSNNGVYNGNWFNDKPHGSGNIKFTKTGVILNGVFSYNEQDNSMVVNGTANYMDNSKYEGLFINYVKQDGVSRPNGDNLANNNSYDIVYGFELRDPTNITVDFDYF